MTDPAGISRRQLIRATAALTAGAALPLAVSRAQADESPKSEPPRPRNIIFMVADGMSAGVPTLAEPFSQLLRKRGTTWARLAADHATVHGLFDMASLDSLVTDSSAASSTWASGSRIFNSAVNMLPDGRKLTPIGSLVKQQGMGFGLVTTTTVTHATPAGFAAVVPSRDLEADIAEQYLGLVDVALGGGSRFFDPATRIDKRDLFASFQQQGYAVCRHRDELLRVQEPPAKTLGAFASSHLPFTIDRDHNQLLASSVPTLAEMTTAALDILSRHHSRRGFLLQVEGGRVDHAAHANDAAAMLHDQLAFDDAIEAVFKFQQRNPDTLVIITTDHGTANPGLNGMGTNYRRSTRHFEKLAMFDASFEAMDAELKAGGHAEEPSGEMLIEMLRAHTGLVIDKDDAASIADALVGRELCEINRQLATIPGMLGQVLGNHIGIQWTGITHTADWALLMATGPGSERFRGLHPCTDAFAIMTDLLGIDHRNPAMTAEEATRFAHSPHQSSPRHWMART